MQPVQTSLKLCQICQKEYHFLKITYFIIHAPPYHPLHLKAAVLQMLKKKNNNKKTVSIGDVMISEGIYYY